MKTPETPRQIVAWLGDVQRKKLRKCARYGKRSQWIRDAIDAYQGPFVPRETGKKNKLSPECMRFFAKQMLKIRTEAKKGYRSQYVRDAIDAFSNS